MNSYDDFKLTTWVNPTNDIVKLKLWVGHDRGGSKPWMEIVIPPGQEKPLPSEFDTAIHQVDNHGIVVGGKAPQLRKKNDPSYKLNPALDSDLSARQEALRQAQVALEQKHAVEMAASMAHEQLKLVEAKRDKQRELEDKLFTEQKAKAEAKAEAPKTSNK